jgi:hypothetical protein
MHMSKWGQQSTGVTQMGQLWLASTVCESGNLRAGRSDDAVAPCAVKQRIHPGSRLSRQRVEKLVSQVQARPTHSENSQAVALREPGEDCCRGTPGPRAVIHHEALQRSLGDELAQVGELVNQQRYPRRPIRRFRIHPGGGVCGLKT